MKRYLSIISLSLFVCVFGTAKDSLHLVCSGIGTLHAGGTDEKVPLGIIFDEFRAEDGQSRTEVLSAIYQQDLYQGRYTNSKDFEDTERTITLKNKTSHREFLRNGKYTITRQRDRYIMKLSGTASDDPTVENPVYSPMEARLSCVDISV